MFTLYKVKIYFQNGCKTEDDSAGVLSMLKIRINPSPSLSRKGLHNSRRYFYPLWKHSPPVPLGFRPPPATTHSPGQHPWDRKNDDQRIRRDVKFLLKTRHISPFILGQSVLENWTWIVQKTAGHIVQKALYGHCCPKKIGHIWLE